jgi:hypothetical protein
MQWKSLDIYFLANLGTCHSIYYYHFILTMYEPLLEQHPEKRLDIKQIIDNANRYLQTLTRLYYLRHGFDAMDLFIVAPLMVTGYDTLDAIDQTKSPLELEDLRSTLMFVAHGLYKQRRNQYLANALFQVILHRMNAPEVSLFKSLMSRDDLEQLETETQKAMVQEVRSHWPVSVVKRKEDMDSHILGNLVEGYFSMDLG